MKTENSIFVQKLIDEMQLRNYSSRTITTYSILLSKLEHFFGSSIDRITTDQLKAYLHQRILKEGISVSLVNQTISAYKIIETDILKETGLKSGLDDPGKKKSSR